MRGNYLETAYLILYGELPTKAELKNWTHNITFHTIIHENIKKFINGLHYDATPWAVSTVAALSTFWVAQWEEMLSDPEQKIARPRQVYSGPAQRSFLPLEQRS